MRRLRLALAAWLLCVLCAAGPARAAAALNAYSSWNVDGPEVRVRFTLPFATATRLVPNTPRLDAAQASAAAGALLGVGSAGGECAAVVQNEYVGKYYVLATQDGAYRFEMSFRCPVATGVVLHDRVLFDRSPDYVDDARVQVHGAAPVLRLFTHAHPNLAIPASGPLPQEGLGVFARQGLGLLLGDAAAFGVVAGMVLLSRRWSHLGYVALALVLGYAAAFAIVWSSAVAANVALAHAGMGATAAILGVCALRRQAQGQGATRRWIVCGAIGAALAGAAVIAAGAAKGPPALFTAAGLVAFGLAQAWLSDARIRPGLLLLTPGVLFGVLDGSAWAEGLARLQMPASRLASAFLGYSLGAVAGLVVAAGGAMAVLWLGRRWLTALRPAAADLAAAALAGLGLFLFVGRLASL